MQQFGRYTIEREIGRGEMGIVYLAVDPVLDRRVALKTVRIPDGLDEAERAEYLKRFYREAQAAGKLSHPGIVTIYDAGMDETTRSHFMAMEYIAGVTLKQLLAGGPRIAPRQAAFIVAGVAEALDYAHAHGVVHRDVKPANIILTDRGAVKIADFGIAKVPSSHLTTEGTYLGTPAYTSPEQVLGRPVNGRSDLFSLGIVLYELLAGKKPFPAENLGQLFHAIAYEPHLPLTKAMPGCPPELSAVVDRVLSKDEEVRYASGADMARDLRAFLGIGTQTFHDLSAPVEPGPGDVFTGPAPAAENPLSDLIAYLEETTRRLAPKEEASEALTTPAASPAPVPSPTRPGIRARALRMLAARHATAWLTRALSPKIFWALAGGAALAALFIMGSLRSQAARQFPPDAPSPTVAPVTSHRAAMRAGREELGAGKVEQALARFQAVRLRRPASPILSSLINDALTRLQESLKADKTPPEQARRLLDLGQEASRRGDNFSAAEFIQAALSVEPANPDAAAALQDLEKQSAPPATTESTGSAVRLVFESPAPRGYLTVNVDGAQVLRKEFSFAGTKEAKHGIHGRLEEPIAVTGGRHRLQVWITIKNGKDFTAYGSTTGEVKPGGSATLLIRLEERTRKLVLTFES